MTVRETALPGVVVVEPVTHGDARGFFRERFHAERYAEAARAHGAPGLAGPFVQDNHSRSRRGVLRGLHFQRRHPQGKLVECARGRIYDVAVDLREGSPAFGRWVGVELDDVTGRQLWVPPGLAHGFCVLSEEADVLYRCTAPYHPDDEGGLAWDDPALGIDWPVEAPALSERDRRWPRLPELTPDDLPHAPFEG